MLEHNTAPVSLRFAGFAQGGVCVQFPCVQRMRRFVFALSNPTSKGGWGGDIWLQVQTFPLAQVGQLKFVPAHEI